MIRYSCILHPYTLDFNREVRTSRNTMTQRDIILIEVADNFGRTGVGEIAPLEGLSMELDMDFEEKLLEVQKNVEHYLFNLHELEAYPSILFGLESAWLNYKKTSKVYYHSPFTTSGVSIPINGLIWMDSYKEMQRQADKILSQSPKCIKLKIGGIAWEEELKLIEYIAEKSGEGNTQIRLDANGAFSYTEAIEKLNILKKLPIHSIEQPLKKSDDKYPLLTDQSDIKIALDEELIGVIGYEQKYNLLKEINPAYIVLKPSLHGGLLGCQEWIFVARQLEIGWWVTSALESNLGLMVIAQWASTFPEAYQIPQGLGTGSLYSNNFSTKLHIENFNMTFVNS